MVYMVKDTDIIRIKSSSVFVENIKYLCICNKPIIFDGDLYCLYNELIYLPDNLTVTGYLDCSYNNLKTIPNNLNVKTGIDCSHNNIWMIPLDTRVKGSINCAYNNIIEEITKEMCDRFTMDIKQLKIYNRVMKLKKLKNSIKIKKECGKMMI